MKTLGITIGLVKIPVTDFARATAFYRDVLGLEEQFAVEQYGWAQYSTGPVSLCLYVVGMGGGNGKPGGDVGVQLRVSDAKAAHAIVTSRGGKVGKLEIGDDGTVAFDIYDPDGNKVSVAQVPVEG